MVTFAQFGAQHDAGHQCVLLNFCNLFLGAADVVCRTQSFGVATAGNLPDIANVLISRLSVYLVACQNARLKTVNDFQRFFFGDRFRADFRFLEIYFAKKTDHIFPVQKDDDAGNGNNEGGNKNVPYFFNMKGPTQQFFESLMGCFVLPCMMPDMSYMRFGQWQVYLFSLL